MVTMFSGTVYDKMTEKRLRVESGPWATEFGHSYVVSEPGRYDGHQFLPDHRLTYDNPAATPLAGGQHRASGNEEHPGIYVMGKLPNEAGTERWVWHYAMGAGHGGNVYHSTPEADLLQRYPNVVPAPDSDEDED